MRDPGSWHGPGHSTDELEKIEIWHKPPASLSNNQGEGGWELEHIGREEACIILLLEMIPKYSLELSFITLMLKLFVTLYANCKALAQTPNPYPKKLKAKGLGLTLKSCGPLFFITHHIYN